MKGLEKDDAFEKNLEKQREEEIDSVVMPVDAGTNQCLNNPELGNVNINF